jgi:short-subunit dehydrogenase
MGQALKGKVAIITGASSGVGWQSAVRLAEQGVKLWGVARREEALELLCRDLRARGAEAHPFACDVTDAAQVEAAVEGCLARYGRVDILVNNAAVQAYGYFDQLEWSEIERTFNVNTFGCFRFARAVLPHFRKQKSGHIINVASMLSLGAAPLLSAYTASKHAQFGWSEALRLELMGTGIDVSAIMVPSVSTPMFDHAPTHLDLAPQPVPPTYHPDVAARAVVQAAMRPTAKIIPVILQGTLMLWAQKLFGPLTDRIMGQFGARMQMRNEPVHRREGNLYQPVPQGVGPMGSVPPTPRWKRLGGGAALAGLGAGVLAAVGLGAAKLVRAAR